MPVALTVGEGLDVPSFIPAAATAVEYALLVLAMPGLIDTELGVALHWMRKTPSAMSKAQPARDAICGRENVHLVLG